MRRAASVTGIKNLLQHAASILLHDAGMGSNQRAQPHVAWAATQAARISMPAIAPEPIPDASAALPAPRKRGRPRKHPEQQQQGGAYGTQIC